MKLVAALSLTLSLSTSLLAGCLVVPGGEGLEITDDACVNACNDQDDACDAGLDCELLCDEIRDRDCEDLYLEALECLADSADQCRSDECDAEMNAFGECYVGD